MFNALILNHPVEVIGLIQVCTARADTGFLPRGGDFFKIYVPGQKILKARDARAFFEPPLRIKSTFCTFKTHFIPFLPCIYIINRGSGWV